jgi:hypothetical protein
MPPVNQSTVDILEEKVNTNNFTNFNLIKLVRLQFCAIGIQ